MTKSSLNGLQKQQKKLTLIDHHNLAEGDFKMWGRNDKNSDYNPKIKFDHEFSVEKAGKKIVWKTYIEEANEDVEPYKVFEKYNSLEKIKLDIDTVHGDFEEYNDLRKNLDREIKAKQMWETLPWEVRKEFGNDINVFRDNGQNWINNKIEVRRKEKEAYEKAIKLEEEKQKLQLQKLAKEELEKGVK